jgi:hypothetical protein
VDGKRRGGAAALHVDRRHALGKEPPLDQRREAHQRADAALAALPHAAGAEPGRLDEAGVHGREAGVGAHRRVGLAREVLERELRPLAEKREAVART